MTDPIFWLGLSLLLVAVSLCAVLVALFPAIQALAQAARSVEKLADTLAREFPPTLEAIRLTGLEISELTDDLSEGVQSASGVVKQVDQSLTGAKKQAQKVQTTTGSLVTGVKVAWNTFKGQSKGTLRAKDNPLEQLPPTQRVPVELPSGTEDRENSESLRPPKKARQPQANLETFSPEPKSES